MPRYDIRFFYVAVPGAVTYDEFIFFNPPPPCVLMAVDEKKFETIAKQIAQQRTPQVYYIHIYINTYINSFGDREIEWSVCCNGNK